ncbi:fibronectin type III domain-containing protein [Corallococcus sp. bb12-1]|uniref:fibronectin type III domain-containing protein n=1 Tax=Corallococcus sp. bb12-1 TaxID=2996784 RepID=UPI0022701148|nr:fibronectin type III domain-containing protein [Corallococcus sp. bb12-1]MCY1043342.1 fibronectin type III domain-containing protein [Corallococcus sp. bb12-1]
MRTLSPAESAALSCRAGFASHVRVLVLRGATWTDLSTLLPGDYLLGASWSDSIDAPVSTASVSVVRNGPDGKRLALAPMVVASLFNTVDAAYQPLLREGAYFRVELATVPLDTRRAAVPSGTWREVWRGRIDEVDAGGDELRLSGRDLGGLLQDTWAEVERTYGSTAGTPVQAVIQSILNDNGMSSFGLYTPVDPLSVRGPYVQEREPLLDAVTFLAEQIGWDLRMRWREDVGAFALTLGSPNRTTDVPVATFGPDNVQEFSELKRSLEHVRNVVEVVYSDKADKDATGAKKRKTVTATHAASIALYGRRWMQVAEAASSLIDTEVEATRLAAAALADLSESALSLSLTLPGVHWYLEAADLVEVLPDGVHFDTPQRIAVVSAEHECASSGEARTKLQLQGRPSTSRAVWAEKDARPGVAASAPFTGPPAPSGLTVTNTVNGFSLAWMPADTGPSWDSYELHVSSTASFIPSQATYRENSRTTSFNVANLVAGRAYYARVIPRDKKGNAGPASAEVTLAPRYVAPAMLQPTVTYAERPLNADFEALSNPALPPDGWGISPGTWGVDATDEASNVYSGIRAVRLAPTLVATKIGSQRFSVRAGDLLFPSALVRGGPEAFNSSYYSVLLLAWLDGNFNLVSITEVDRLQFAFNWQELGRGANAVAPSGARYCQLYIGKLNALAYTLYVDSARVEVQSRPQDYQGAVLIPTSGWVSTGFPRGNPKYYKNSSGDVVLAGSIKNGSFGSAAFTLPAGYRSLDELHLPVVSNTGFGRLHITADGNVTPMSGSTTEFSLDGVRFRVEA